MRRFSRWRDDDDDEDDDEEDGGGSNPNPQPVGGVKIMSRRMSTSTSRRGALTKQERREPNEEEGRVVMVPSEVLSRYGRCGRCGAIRRERDVM